VLLGSTPCETLSPICLVNAATGDVGLGNQVITGTVPLHEEKT
jgi:hypothetical protein